MVHWSDEVFIIDDRYPEGHHRREVARGHRYRLEDGVTVGASGKLDPKSLMIEDINYRGLKSKDPRCGLCEAGDMIPVEERFVSSTYRPKSKDQGAAGI